MIIDCIADLHGCQPNLPGGDLLILAGDCTAGDTLTQWAKFFKWFKKQPYTKKILVAGNHDNFLESGFPKSQKEIDDWKEVSEFVDSSIDFEYLCDSGTEHEGIKIWGMPWTNYFPKVNPKCKAFMVTEEILESKVDLIPPDTSILVTHGPPYGILDRVKWIHCGSEALSKVVLSQKRLPKLNYHIFGHIHEWGGADYMISSSRLTFVNCSYVNERYIPTNKPFRIEI